MKSSNPYRSPAPIASDRPPLRHLPVTRRVITVIVAVCLTVAVVQCLYGAYSIQTTPPPFDILFADREYEASRYRDALVRGAMTIVRGFILGILGMVAWRRSRRLLDTGPRHAELPRRFRRFATYGFATAAVTAIVREAIPIDGLPRLLDMLDFMACGLSLVALALAYDLRIPIRAQRMPYVLAILGAALSGYALLGVVRRFREIATVELQHFF